MFRHTAIGFLIIIATALFLASCGGSGSSLGIPEAGSTGTDTPVVTEGTATDWSGLPTIPLETEADRVSSLIGDPHSVLGKDYLSMDGGTVVDDALYIENMPEINPDELGSGEEYGLKYAMYKLSSLDGLKPESLNIECVQEGLGDGYFVGVADYTDNTWKWFGPVTLPEFQLDLREVNHQMVTFLGNMYFMIVVPPGNAVTHYSSTVLAGPADDNTHPGIPHHLVASDGQFAEEVRLDWLGGSGANLFQVFRKPVLGPGEWEMIGETAETRYTDAPLPDYKMFYYRVRSANSAGESRWSNMDSGFAGGGDDPVVIRGEITNWNGQPVPGVHLALVGMDDYGEVVTDEQGRFRFDDLPPAEYIVAPFHPELAFGPRYHYCDMTERAYADIHFNAVLEEVFHRVGGFVVTVVEQNGVEQVLPLPGRTVAIHPVGDPDEVYTVTTDENGFYLITDIPEGVYVMGPVAEGWNFLPPYAEIVINGHNRPDRHDFVGFPAEE